MIRVLFARGSQRIAFAYNISNVWFETFPCYIHKTKIDSLIICRNEEELWDFIADSHSKWTTGVTEENCEKALSTITTQIGMLGVHPPYPIYFVGDDTNSYNILHPKETGKIKKLLD